eukprot:588686-Rhodomonas_salina.2
MVSEALGMGGSSHEAELYGRKPAMYAPAMPCPVLSKSIFTTSYAHATAYPATNAYAHATPLPVLTAPEIPGHVTRQQQLYWTRG